MRPDIYIDRPAEVELMVEERIKDDTGFGSFVCPKCSHVGHLAFGRDSFGKIRRDYCVKCGTRVVYRIPGGIL